MQTKVQPAAEGISAPSGSAEESVLYTLMSIGRLMRQRLQGDDMDPATFWLLKGLATHGALRVTELAALANLDASTVSRHVQQLHRSGLIERTPDPDDGRAQRVALSSHGRDRLNEGLARRRALLGKSFEGWHHDDIRALDTLLARFAGNLEHNTELEHA
ncbi:MAG TPA: MarR family transcriptional regulator [Propionibacteriaceae bacterium]|jgi:DNA-binding MarR family transcriptional regulator